MHIVLSSNGIYVKFSSFKNVRNFFTCLQNISNSSLQRIIHFGLQGWFLTPGSERSNYNRQNGHVSRRVFGRFLNHKFPSRTRVNRKDRASESSCAGISRRTFRVFVKFAKISIVDRGLISLEYR